MAVQQLRKLNLYQNTNKHIFTPVGIEIIKETCNTHKSYQIIIAYEGFFSLSNVCSLQLFASGTQRQTNANVGPVYNINSLCVLGGGSCHPFLLD